MADFIIRIVADPRAALVGTQKVQRGLKQTQAAAVGLGAALKSAFAFVGAGFAVRESVKLIDSFTNLQNKLRVVTEGQYALTKATEDLFEVSQRTRSSFEATVGLYSRLALSTKELGTSSKELTQFTESLNKAVIISGATAQEAEAGIIQLSQGIASGALRGDELRSVLEQLPAVADVISKSLGITRGELRKFGTEGKITADVILKAFKEARVELDERFNKTIPTVAQSFQVLKNNLIRLTGVFDSNTGIAGKLSQAVIFLSNNLETLIKVLGVLATTLGVALALKAIPKLILAFKSLAVAIAANPFGAVVVAATALISAIALLGDEIKVTKDGIVTLQDVGVAIWNNIKGGVDILVKFFKKNFPIITDTVESVFGDIDLSFKGLIDAALFPVNSLIGIFTGFVEGIKFIFKDGIAEAIPRAFNTAFIGAIKFIEIGFNSIISTVNKAVSLLGGEGFKKLDLTETFGLKEAERDSEGFAKAFKKGFNDSRNLIQRAGVELIQQGREVANQRLQLEAETQAALLEQQAKYQEDALQKKKGFDNKLFQADLDIAGKRFKNASDLFGSLAQIQEAFGRGQSKTFKRLFAVSKAFAIAESTVKILQGIANAASLPFPGNLAAMASVAAATASIVTTIASTDFKGAFQNGGSFRVGGGGGTDSQMVSFRASPNETVSITTPGQEAQKNRQMVSANPVVNVNVINNKSDAEVTTEQSVNELGEITIGVVIDAAIRNKNGMGDVIRQVASQKG